MPDCLHRRGSGPTTAPSSTSCRAESLDDLRDVTEAIAKPVQPTPAKNIFFWRLADIPGDILSPETLSFIVDPIQACCAEVISITSLNSNVHQRFIWGVTSVGVSSPALMGLNRCPTVAENLDRTNLPWNHRTYFYCAPRHPEAKENIQPWQPRNDHQLRHLHTRK